MAYSLPAFPDPLTNAMQYGDFYSYSLPLLDYLEDGNGYKSGDLWHVNLAQPKDNPIVVYTHANNVKDNPPGMDDAYDSVTGNTDDDFSTGVEPDPTPTLTYDSSDYWDVELGALIGHLAGNDLYFFFNNAQHQNVDNLGFPEDHIFAWGQVIIEDADNSNGLVPLYFDFTNVNTSNNVSSYSNATRGDGGGVGPVTDYTSYSQPGDYVLSGGDLYYYLADGHVLPYDDGSGVYVLLPHNLGANEAAYALTSPEINEGLQGWLDDGYDYMRVDFRLEHLNDGPDQVFILANPSEYSSPIPEPATLILLGSGLVGFAGTRIRKRFKK